MCHKNGQEFSRRIMDTNPQEQEIHRPRTGEHCQAQGPGSFQALQQNKITDQTTKLWLCDSQTSETQTWREL